MSSTLAGAPAARNLPRPALPQAEPCTVVIFGAAGDLAKRKLVPALFNLACEGCKHNRFRILGVGRTEMSDADFRALMHHAVKTAKDTRDFSEDRWTEFAARLSYMIGDPNDDGTHEEIAAHLDAAGDDAARNRLFYLSTPPSAAASIINGLGAAGLHSEDKGWSRIVVEKPFGRDLESARELNETLANYFDEHQVYRIDHFLGKDTVQNILVFRFGNSMFEPVWNRNYIDYVEITAAEELGVGSRAGFYEETGALRDMIANHLLQLLTLTAMEPPVAFDADSIREQKVQVLRSIRPLTPDEVKTRTVRAQYAAGMIDSEPVPGYRDESGATGKSSIETYAAIEFRIENWRWAGVPFYVRTGKRLGRKLTEIAVHLKRTPQAFFTSPSDPTTPPAHDVRPNIIALRIQPHEGITISFAVKVPGVEMQTSTAQLNFDYETAFQMRSPAAYETLLLDVMQGDPTLFTRRDETEAQWRLITPIEEAWAGGAGAPPLEFYAAGSNGAAAADELLARAGHAWRSLAVTKNRTVNNGRESNPPLP